MTAMPSCLNQMKSCTRTVARVALISVLVVACSGQERAPKNSTPVVSTSAPPALFPEFEDNDPHDWTGRGPDSYPVHGVDVSRWQGDLDWSKAKASGVSFAYIKATEGGDLVDPVFEDAWAASRRAGMPRGAYHYFYHCRPAAEQARWFIKHVPRDGRALPHALDMEWNPRSKTCRIKPSGSKIRAEAKRFLDILEAHYGRRPIVYTTVDYYRETGIGDLRNTEFWLRSVADHPSQTYPGADWTFWQYSGTGRIPGVSSNIDLNAFRFSPQAWLAWSGR